MIYGILRHRANLTRTRAREQLQKFCEHEEESTRLNFASKSSKCQILRAVENCNDHSIYTPSIGQVCSEVWCRPYLEACFDSFELGTFSWPLLKIQVSAFFPLHSKIRFQVIRYTVEPR